jgi:outer membrane protein assembly factor BamB
LEEALAPIDTKKLPAMRRLWLYLTFLVHPLWAADDWREFRGVNGQGISDATEVPLVWSEKQSVKWKTALPGKGASSPVVISNQVWLTTATDNHRSLRAICLARETGEILHDLELFQVNFPETLNNPLSSLASPSPVAEPGRVYFAFGTYGNAAVATDTGRVLWRNREFVLGHDNCGPGSSPILYGKLFVTAFDGVGLRCVAALDKQTGKLQWMTERPNAVPGPFASKSFSTPVVVKVGGRDQILSLGPLRLGAYDPANGKELWACDLPGWSIVARPVVGSNVVYVSSGGDVPELWAVRLNGADRESRVLWRYKRQIPMVSSPILVGEHLYFTSDSGMLTCLEARNGASIWSERLSHPHYASPLLARGRLYWFSEDGATTVIKPGLKLDVLAENKLDSGCLATPAIAGRAIFLRTKTHLYRIEE